MLRMTPTGQIGKLCLARLDGLEKAHINMRLWNWA